MPDFASAFKVPLALSSFGFQRLLGALPLGDTDAARALQANLYKAGDSAKQDFSANSLLFGAFEFTDKAQSALINLATDAVTLKVLRPSYVWNAVSEIVQGSTDAFESVATSTSRRLLREQFGNTFDVIGFVNHADAPSELAADGTYPDPTSGSKALCSARRLPGSVADGKALASRYAEAYMKDGRQVRGLLSAGKGATLPEKTQLMLHAGMGIAFAKVAMARLTPCSSDNDINAALKMFLETVQANAQERYIGAAHEALGLVTRTWYGQMVGLVYDHLVPMDGPASEFSGMARAGRCIFPCIHASWFLALARRGTRAAE